MLPNINKNSDLIKLETKFNPNSPFTQYYNSFTLATSCLIDS